MSKGGSSRPSGPQEVTQISSNLPEYAEPYFRKALERTVYESARPYQTYTGSRMADFTPEERMSMQGMTEMAAAGTPWQMRQASDIASRTGYQPIGQGLSMAREFQPQPIISQYTGPQIDPGYQAGDIGQGYQAGQRGAEYQAGPFDPGYQAGDISQGYEAGPFDPGYQAGDISQDYRADQRMVGYTGQPGFGIQQFGPGFSPGTVADPQTLERYMSPYQQMVTDIEKREARRESDIAGSQIGQQAAQTGGMGGYREAIMQAERERNLGQQLGDIQSRGSQLAFQQAQQAFEADRAARLQAGQLGLQTGQAREQALQAGERFGQQQFMTNEQLRQQQQQAELGVYQAGERARQQAGAMGLTAQQAEDRARQAEQQARLSVYQAGEQARQQAGAMGLTAQQQEDAARQAQERFGQQQFATNEQLRQQQQQADLSVYQAGESARQQAGRMGMSAQEIEDRGRQAENQARMGAQQFNIQQQRAAAELGIRGLGFDQATRDQQLRAAQQLGGYGSQEQQMAYERLKNMQAAGEMQRQLSQQGLTMGYQDFLRQQAYPREQVAFYNQILRGLPIQPGTTQATFGGPSSIERMLGSGIAGVGLYRGLRGG